MANPVSPATRSSFDVPFDDPDFVAVRGVLGHYGSAAGYSRSCAMDLAVLVKNARQKAAC
jgi:hypothetical protein